MDDEQLDALLVRLGEHGFGLPAMARAADYPDLPSLQEANRVAWERNRVKLRAALEGQPAEV